MAKKDWERTRNGWYNEKKDQQLEVSEGSSQTSPTNSKQGWLVMLRIFSDSPDADTLKFTKTKAQAMTFADNYMRTH